MYKTKLFILLSLGTFGAPMQYGMSPQYQMTAQAHAHAASALAQGTMSVPHQVHFQSQNLNYIQAATPQGFIINQPTVN